MKARGESCDSVSRDLMAAKEQRENFCIPDKSLWKSHLRNVALALHILLSNLRREEGGVMNVH